MKYMIQFDGRFVRVNNQTVSLSRKPVPYASHQKAQEAAKIFRANIAEDITFFQDEIASAKTELTRIQNDVTTLGQEFKSAKNSNEIDFVALESKLTSLRDQAEAISRAYELAVIEVKYLRKYKPQLVKETGLPSAA
jgi:hypothetical protein